MSREGAQSRIDSLKLSLDTRHYHRTGLGNAVRFHAAVNLVNETLAAERDGTLDEFTGRLTDLEGRVSRSEFVRELDESISDMNEEFDRTIEEELGLVDDRFDTKETIQQRLANGAYRTRLGRTAARATTEHLGMYQDANSPFNTGAVGAFRSFTNGFVQDDEDFFGSRVLYDNVFGAYEDGGESLTMKRRLTISDPTNDVNRTVGDKVLDDVVNRSIYDQTEIIDRVDTEFARFHGESMIDQMSMTGAGLRTARATIRQVMLESSAYGRQIADRGEGTHPIDYANAMTLRAGEGNVSEEAQDVQTSLTLLDNNLKNRSGQSAATDGGFVNKAGVAEFIDLINTAGTRSENGELTGGYISISSFQFQNETISAALTDKIQRHVLESALQGGTGKPLQVDLVLAYPRQRNLSQKNDDDNRYGVGSTNYNILGPNLIEAMKLEEVKNEVYDMLRGLGVADDQLESYLKVNIQFRDKKFHPKVYLTDNVAGIGSQNLTGPVGNSINQAGSNFETMLFVANKYKDDTQLEKERDNFVPFSNDERRQQADNNLKNDSIVQSLLYRQITNAVEYEMNYTSQGKLDRAGGGTSTPILNNRRGNQIGFAGDIYEHMRNTINYAYETNFNIVNGSQKGQIRKEVAGQNTTHMFMVLDQSFMLQAGSDSAMKMRGGEMGAEIGSPFGEEEEAYTGYREQQNKLFDLLIANKATVRVDAKNYREGVVDPLVAKIKTRGTAKLQENFQRFGQSLGLMAGYDLFDPGSANTPEEYSAAMKAMRQNLRRLGFDEESGFSDADLKHLIGLASGNIEMATAPKQHAKMFGLMDYREGGSPELISYYMGSSNMGLYSLGIPTGSDGGFRPNDGDLTNTEIGIMLGRRDMADGTNLSRVNEQSARMSRDHMSDPTDINGIKPIDASTMDQWSLNQEEERYMLMQAQRHLVQTWSQLGNSQMDNPNFMAVPTKPLWQQNVNTGDLNILKNRLETLASDLGVSSSAFKIVERYGATSGSGLTSINVTIDMAQMLGSKGFLNASAKLPKLNFELTVLQGPSRGSGMFADRTDDGSVPGFVYFVDKNQVVGNGIFSNDSGKAIQVLGRRNYEDDFVSDPMTGRLTLQSGESAHMSSLDIVPQMFATLIGEGIERFGAGAADKDFRKMDYSDRESLLIEFMSKTLSGYGDQVDESTGKVFTAAQLLAQDINSTNKEFFTAKIQEFATSLEARADFTESRDPQQRRLQRRRLMAASSIFVNRINQIVDSAERDGRGITGEDVRGMARVLNDYVMGHGLGEGVTSYEGSVQLANKIMKTTGRVPDEARKLQEFKEFQSLMFGSFLQSRDDRTYGGQQGFYRTLLMGLGDSTIDRQTANLMFELDTENQGLHNVGAYARFKPLAYNPTTDIHEVLYRSVASKSTSMTKGEPGLDSLLFDSEARDLGDAANLRLMSSIGIGVVTHRDQFIKVKRAGDGTVVKDADGNVIVDHYGNQQAVFDAMEAAGVEQTALLKAKQEYVRAVSQQFGNLDGMERGDTVRLEFYTGSAKKLSQLPQRIKNAMGARPLYQFSVEAQMAMAQGESISQLTDNYLARHKDPIKKATAKKVQSLLDQYEALKAGGATEEQLASLDRRIDDLQVIGAKAFNDRTAGLGAIFRGKVKAVLSEEQVSFITATKKRMEEAMAELLEEGEISQEDLNELIRVEVMKAGLVNKGLGKMISGSNNMNYSMSIIQLTGTYNDTFLANPLYGTVYKSETAYQKLRSTDTDIYALNQDELRAAGVLNVGMQEGYFETQQKSIKGSMMGPGGMEVLLQKDDIIVEDPDTGAFVQRRKVNGKWVTVNQVDTNRNLHTVRNVIDNTNFSDVGSPTLGSAPTTSYGRRGEESIDYIYDVNARPGNFTNNEYLLDFQRLRAIKPASGRRVEGTDSASLVKGVAFFAGRISRNGREMNLFEDLERQYMESYEQGEVGGALKAYLDYRSATQRVTLADGSSAYAPMSSSIQGVFNANNFKSFFWSHGATILKSQTEIPDGGKTHFMLDELFSTKQEVNVTNAKKLAGALLLQFGTDFLTNNSADQAGMPGAQTKIKQAMVDAMLMGEYGDKYRSLAMTTAMQIKASDVNTFYSDSEKNVEGLSKAEITTNMLFDKMANQSGFNGVTLGGLKGITTEQLIAVMSGDETEASKLLETVRKGMIQTSADNAASLGGINFGNHADKGAALVVTAVDLMHQLSRSGSRLELPSDIDLDSGKMKEVLFNMIGLQGGVDDEYKEDIVQFVNAVNTQINAVTVFTDITFSFSKDPTGTQSVARHEAQHLIQPFMGDIQKYREGGQLDKIQHTVAGLAALVAGQQTGLIYYDRMARSGFGEKSALNLAAKETDFMFTSFHKQKFLGFYQQGQAGIATDNYIKAYKNINEELAAGSKYNWNDIQVVRNINDATQISSFRANGQTATDTSLISDALEVVNKHIDKFYPNVDPTERARLQDKFLKMGGQQFALHQMDMLVEQMSHTNARFQADPRKTTGKDTTSQFLQAMDNKQMFITIPDLDFTQQNGEIVARTDSRRGISTVLPSAQDMRVLGAQYADFVDPILSHYKNISAIFVPGTLENKVFEKVRLAAQNNEHIVLSTTEFNIYKQIQESAMIMPTELAKGVAGARAQEAAAGKNKYQGFTSTAIGSFLMPFGAAALAQAKLDEAGMRVNKARFEAVRHSDIIIRGMKQKHQRRFTPQEQIFITMEQKFGRPNDHNTAEFHRTLESTKHFQENIKLGKEGNLGSLQGTMGRLASLRRQGYTAIQYDLSKKAQAGNIVSTLNELQRLHDQLAIMVESDIESTTNKELIKGLQNEVQQFKGQLLNYGATHFGLQEVDPVKRLQRESAALQAKNLGIYDPNDDRIELIHEQNARIGVYGVYDEGTDRVYSPNEFKGQDALPIVEIFQADRMGYTFEDEEGQEQVLQRAGFQASYAVKGMSDFRAETTALDIATARPFDLSFQAGQTHKMQMEEEQRTTRMRNLVMEELEARFPDDPSRPAPDDEPNKRVNTTAMNDPADTAVNVQNRSRAQNVVHETFNRRYAAPAEVTAERRDPLYESMVNFHRKQKAAVMLGISKNLEDDFNNMKREAIETKNKIAKFMESKFLSVDEKKKALRGLRKELRQKRDQAYEMAGISRRTGKSTVDKNGFPVRNPSQQDSYIYHAQALNYESLMNELLIQSSEADLDPLSEDHIKELKRKQDFIREKGVFALNSGEDADGRLTFSQLGALQTGFDPKALFMVELVDEDGGTVQKHMKAMGQISNELRTAGMDDAADRVAAEYARNQIDAQIAMYEKRMADMDKMAVEREVHSNKRDANGDLIIDENTQKKLNEAHADYNANTRRLIDELIARKMSIANGAKPSQIRTVFEDIDILAAELDHANVQMAEVFRSPPPGGTDPRLHTYRVMQGIMALNQVSQQLQKIGSSVEDLGGSSVKMMYSTERGQTATVMAALGIVTYGGGDWDGDSYTAIFHQAENMQSAIQKYQAQITQNELFVKEAEKELVNKKAALAGMDADNPKYQQLSDEIEFAETRVQQRKTDLRAAQENFTTTQADFERQVQDGYKGLHARARGQLSAYTGIDERFFVSDQEVLYDVNGKVRKDSEGNAITGLRQGATMDADAMFVYMEKGYGLIEQLDSKRNQVIGLMNNIDALTGYRNSPEAFNNDGFMQQLANGFRDTHTNKISAEHPNVAILKERAASVLRENQSLDDNQRDFLTSISEGSDAISIAYLEEFNKLTRDMGLQEASAGQTQRTEAENAQRTVRMRSHMNRWVGTELFGSLQSHETIGKFMKQGMGMNLTEGTFDMTLKVLGKAGGEILGKTYNTIISSTFQDAPIITYGNQLLDETNPLHSATRNEFQRQFEADDDRRQAAMEEGRQQGRTGKKLDNYVRTKLRAQGYEEFQSYIKTTRDAVEASKGVQGFMKNIHQLLRDSIKLTSDNDLLGELQEKAEDYNRLSREMVDAGDDEAGRQELADKQESIIANMASKLGPGPGLKSLIDLDYLTNEFNRDGISKQEFESRFFDGTIEDNKERALSLGASMGLSEAEMTELRGIQTGHTEDSMALLKIARGQTARNLAAMVTSFQMAGHLGDERTGVARDTARSQRALLATAIQAGKVDMDNAPRSRTQDGQIDSDAAVDDYIKNKYRNVIEQEHHGARFDATRQHKEALASHLGMEASQVYREDGTISQEYQDKLDEAARKMNVSTEEYLLVYDHLMENNRKVIGGFLGNDGEKMEAFTTMNMNRKNLAQTFLSGRTPGAEGSKSMNEMTTPEIVTTMAQLAAQGKLDSEGMEVFNGMYKGVVRHLLEATDGQIDYLDKSTGEMKSENFNKLNKQQQNAVMTKLMYQNLIGTEPNQEKGFGSSTNQAAKDFRVTSGQMIGNSVLELREDGTMGNEFIDALDKAGEGSVTGAAVKQGEALGEAYLEETLNDKTMFDALLRQYLPTGMDPSDQGAQMYRNQIHTSVQAQMKARQEQMAGMTARSRSRHNRGYGVQSRSSFMNNMNSAVVGQLAKDSSANALDLVMPLLLTAAGTAISEGSIGGDDIMALSGAAFTSFQYARTGTIDMGELDIAEGKKRMAAAQTASGIFKLKNAMNQHGEDIGAAIAQVAVSEAVSVGFNMVATPWLSRNIADKALGAGAAPAMNALDMKRYTAGQQLAGNAAASMISAVSSTLISGVLMNTMQGNGPSISDTIQSFMPAAQAVSKVNEAIARRRAQEAAFEDFQAETDGTDDTIQEYMVVTDATYDPNDYASIADLQAAQEVTPGSDGSLSVGLVG